MTLLSRHFCQGQSDAAGTGQHAAGDTKVSQRRKLFVATLLNSMRVTLHRGPDRLDRKRTAHREQEYRDTQTLQALQAEAGMTTATRVYNCNAPASSLL